MKALLLVLALAVIARAESYAYVTQVNGYRTGTQQHPHDRCTIVAQLPASPIATKPANGDASALGSNARTIRDDTADDNNVCDDLLHTWIAVNDDRVVIPDPGLTISRAIGLVALVLGIGAFVIARRRARARPS